MKCWLSYEYADRDNKRGEIVLNHEIEKEDYGKIIDFIIDDIFESGSVKKSYDIPFHCDIIDDYIEVNIEFEEVKKRVVKTLLKCIGINGIKIKGV